MKDTNLFDVKKINEIYDTLLDINFKLIFYESNRENYDECILPYLNESTTMIKTNQLDQLFVEENRA